MKKYITSVAFFLLFVFIWQTAVNFLKIEKWILPSPLQILNSLLESKELFVYHLLPTLFEAFLGLFISVILAIIVALFMKLSRLFYNIIYPFLILSQTIPFIVIAPLLSVWFGFGLIPKIILIAIVCFFPIALNLFAGFESIDHSFISLLDSMGANKIKKIKFLYWPSSLPYFFSGLKIAVSYSIISAVVSEWVGTDRGLGILLIRSSKSYVTDRVFATILVITFLSILLVLLVEILQYISIPWSQNNKIFKKE